MQKEVNPDSGRSVLQACFLTGLRYTQDFLREALKLK